MGLIKKAKELLGKRDAEEEDPGARLGVDNAGRVPKAGTTNPHRRTQVTIRGF